MCINTSNQIMFYYIVYYLFKYLIYKYIILFINFKMCQHISGVENSDTIGFEIGVGIL